MNMCANERRLRRRRHFETAPGWSNFDFFSKSQSARHTKKMGREVPTKINRFDQMKYLSFYSTKMNSVDSQACRHVAFGHPLLPRDRSDKKVESLSAAAAKKNQIRGLGSLQLS